MVTGEPQRARRRLIAVLRARADDLERDRERRQQRDVRTLRAGALLFILSFALPYLPPLITLPPEALSVCRYLGAALTAWALLRRSSAA